MKGDIQDLLNYLSSENGFNYKFINSKSAFAVAIDDIDVLKNALIKISEIADNEFCGDWEEIEEARNIAEDALSSIQ